MQKLLNPNRDYFTQADLDDSQCCGNSKILKHSFYERDTRIVAYELIGKFLVFQSENKILRGKIVETEAYRGSEDPASHAYRGVTPRTKVMFGEAGFSYVYFTYGFHYCFNVVTEKSGTAGAVLIRAVEPLSGIHLMKKRRGTEKPSELTNGPAKLTQAFGITTKHSNLDLTVRDLHLEEDFIAANTNGKICEEHFINIGVSTRIGIRDGREFLYRFFLKDSPFVSCQKLKKK